MKQRDIDLLRRVAGAIGKENLFEAYLLMRIAQDARPKHRALAREIAQYEDHLRPDSIVAMRDDGLCQRLLAMVYGKLTADALGLEFGFTWQPMTKMEARHGTRFGAGHSVPEDSRAVFSDGFLDAYLLKEDEIVMPPTWMIRGRPKEIEFCLNSLAKYARRESIARPFWLASPAIKQGLKRRLDLAGAGPLFAEQMFSGNICAQIEHVLKRDLPEKSVALHVRGGDVIYGDGRSDMPAQAQRMTIGLITAEYLCQKLVAQGHSVIVFGATKSDLAGLARSSEAIFTAEDFALDRVDAAVEMIREVALMSRCDRIISAPGTSVTRLAALVGNKKREVFTDFLPEEEEFGHLLARRAAADFDDYHDLQKAFACYCLFLLAPPETGAGQKQAFLRDALRYDGDNRKYKALIYFAFLETAWQNESALHERLFGAAEGTLQDRAGKLLALLPQGQPAVEQVLRRAAGDCPHPQGRKVLRDWLK